MRQEVVMVYDDVAESGQGQWRCNRKWSRSMMMWQEVVKGNSDVTGNGRGQ